jgi:hypothetical protein
LIGRTGKKQFALGDYQAVTCKHEALVPPIDFNEYSAGGGFALSFLAIILLQPMHRCRTFFLLLSIVLRMDRLVSSAIQIRTPVGRARGSIFDSCSILCQGLFAVRLLPRTEYSLIVNRFLSSFLSCELVMSWSCPTLVTPTNQSIKDRMYPCRNKVLRLLSKRPRRMLCCKISLCSLQFCGAHTIFRLEHIASTLF